MPTTSNNTSLRNTLPFSTSTDELSGVSVCIPAFNEGKQIREVLAEALATFDEMPGDHEVLVIDDGSLDDTWQQLETARAADPRVRGIRHGQNRGLAAAQRTMIAHARGRYIFHIGADRQWRMAELPRMLALLESGGYDVVVGVRRQKQYTRWRKLVSSVFNWSVAGLWGKHFGDIGSIKLAKAGLWKRIPTRCTSAFINAERLLIAAQHGARITSLQVEHLPRRQGKSSFVHPRRAWQASLDMLRFRFSLGRRQLLPHPLTPAEVAPVSTPEVAPALQKAA